MEANERPGDEKGRVKGPDDDEDDRVAVTALLMAKKSVGRNRMAVRGDGDDDFSGSSRREWKRIVVGDEVVKRK